MSRESQSQPVLPRADKLDAAFKSARSIESREAFGAENRETRYIGCRAVGRNVYHFYEDTEGCFWYTSERTDQIEAELKHIENRKGKIKRPA